MKSPSWICCQLGARENYAVPRAVHSAGMLEEIITDIWAHPKSLIARIPSPAIQQRFCSELENIPVVAANWSFLAGEYFRRTVLGGYRLYCSSNAWFQQFAAQSLEHRYPLSCATPRIVFSYSYTARSVFEVAKRRGWKTVLGQVDLGPVDEQILLESARISGIKSPPHASEAYWDNWRMELELADIVVVNSLWCKSAMLARGVSEDKLVVIPLSYDNCGASDGFRREYPSVFSTERPMRVLFLGRVSAQKGCHQMIEAMRCLVGNHIELTVVGSASIPEPRDLKNVRWIGKVPRHSVGQYYRDADVFLFPTFSDGFGLTQLEAQSWRLPVIASSYCGDVVTHESNGWILANVNAACISEILLQLLKAPGRLAAASEKALAPEDFSLAHVGRRLSALVEL
jgi:glycosyltransferase involved in cell wall biosynthesis